MTYLIRVASGVAFAAALGFAGVGGAMAGNTLSGAYLAGLHAAKIGDLDAAAKYFGRALDRDPGDLALMEQTLLYQAAAGRVDQAMDLAERLIVFDANNRIATLLLTAQELKTGEYRAALDRIEAAGGGFHPLIGSMIGAWAKFGLGDAAGGEAALNGLGERPVFRVFTLYHTGLMRHADNDPEGAVEAYAQLGEKLSTPTGRVASAYAAALIDARKRDEARAVYEAAEALTVGDGALEAEIAAFDAGAQPAPLVETPAEGAAEALFGLAAALGDDGDTRLTLLYARLATWLRPDLYNATLLVAELLDSNNQNEAAIRAYESIPPDSPLARSAEIGRAEALHRLGRNDEAAEALKSLTRRAPGMADAFIALGDLLRRGENYNEAAKAYASAIDLMEAAGRPNWVLFYQRGIAYERAGEWDEAEADFLTALEMQPDQPLVLNYLGYSWLEKGMNIDEAMAMIRKAVDQRPEDGYIVDSLGWGHYLLDEFPAAVRAVELQPIDPVVNDHFGDALWRVGRRLEAEFQWRRALSFDPAEKDRERIRRKLDIGLDAVLEEEEAAAAARSAPVSSANDG
ncbi:tetratricopeptide repeat protein [Pikeienuella piscinae]|uniref:Tetratricopeptide repeat protein n=1 Tax=Pikeienuella piscinae TaxID=2748098 RepID=A0A7L5C1P6_9RHOB|nr:tetratricopeptide repeat protein [Pikeienuella piscinae]QIE55779.1 tetratricopeptide repeat protein [Pikeienuella piscinae]